MRSRAAASVLKNAGFIKAYSMAGGISAWHGLKAVGPPDAGMSFFIPAGGAEDLIGLAWLLEEGSRTFYAAVADMQTEPRAAELFKDLVKAEEQHKQSLRDLYGKLTGKEPGPRFPPEAAAEQSDGDRMEGNARVSEALSWTKGKKTRDLLEFCIALETDSYDRYIQMSRSAPGKNERRVFEQLVAEEQMHLSRLTDLLDSELTIR